LIATPVRPSDSYLGGISARRRYGGSLSAQGAQHRPSLALEHSSSSDGDSLRAAFAATGTVDSASVITDRDTGQSKGFGFVEMSTDSEAQAAISAMNGKTLDGRQIKVNEAKPQERRSGGGGRSHGGGGGYGRGY